MQTESFSGDNQSLEEKSVPIQDVGKKIFDFLTKTKLLDIRKSDIEFENWLQSITYDEFSLYLTRLNGMMRGVSKNKRSVDGKNVELAFGIGGDAVSYLPPQVDQKDGMLKDTFDALKKITSNQNRALLIYYIIQAVHPYADGNGRTGRLMYSILSDGGKNITEEQLSSLIHHDDEGYQGEGVGRKIFEQEALEPNAAYYIIAREVAKKIFGNEIMKKFGKIYYTSSIGTGSVLQEGLEVSPIEKKRVEKILDEGSIHCFPFRSLVVLKFLQEEGKMDDYTSIGIRCVSPKEAGPQQAFEDIGKEMLIIDDEKFLASLDAEAVRRIIKIHNEIKSLFIKEMIDIFENPKNHFIKNKEGEEVLISDTFKK